jgi:8-oxo-dGTP pyrophosphatase MutT (NUDIX family)
MISPHIRDLRKMVGHSLLLLPSTSVLPRDDGGRLLLVLLIDTGKWATIGGMVEPDETPRESAIRESREEVGINVKLGGMFGVFGGLDYRVTYPNGDESAYVVSVFDATVIDEIPRPDNDETSEVGWFRPEELPLNQMGQLTRALFRDLENF